MTDSQRPVITAVIPAFNEENTIRNVVEKTLPFVSQVVVVDDGSTDSTGQIATKAGATVLRHQQNEGYGAALAEGFDYVRNNGANILVVMDADGQHDPGQIPRLVEPIVNGTADIAIGSRFMDGAGKDDMPRYRRFGIGMVNKAWNFASSDTLSDTQCGFRAYSREAIDRIGLKEAGMCASLEILDQASKNNLRLVEVPVSVKYGGDTSTVKPGRHGMELINYVLRKMKEEHPLLIFGGSGVVVSMIGLAFGIYSINSYFESRYLPFGPTIVAGILIYVGTLMVFGGLILNSIQALASKFEEKSSK